VDEGSEHLRRLRSVAEAGLAELPPDEFVHELLARVLVAIDADTAAILLLDVATSELVTHAARGIEEDVEEGLGIRSMIDVPLLASGEAIGVLRVGTLEPRTFGAPEIELLQLASERAASAIGHGRAFEAGRRLAQRLLKLEAVTDTALTHLDADDLLDELLDRLRALLEGDTCAILLIDEATDELVARAARGIEGEVERGVRIPIGRGFAGRIAAERRPIVIDDVDHADILNPILREKGIKSLVGAPLVTRDKIIGVIHVGSLEPRIFTAEEVELLQLAAERAATGLEKALIHEQLVRFDQVRHAFVAIASHELRTPSAAVIGAAVTLYERAGQLRPEQEHELKRMLAEQSERLGALIEQLLDLSRLELRALDFAPKPLRVREELERIALAFAGNQRDQITIEAPPELEASADPVALERIVGNLLVNAIRHGAPPIVVSAEQAQRHLRITVEDGGSGIPADVRDRLFQPFARSVTAAGPSGSGLGLAIAKSYAAAVGGDLVYDGRDTRGARFRLILPAPRRR
jgi:signal transduction histidine kinase